MLERLNVNGIFSLHPLIEGLDHTYIGYGVFRGRATKALHSRANKTPNLLRRAGPATSMTGAIWSSSKGFSNEVRCRVYFPDTGV